MWYVCGCLWFSYPDNSGVINCIVYIHVAQYIIYAMDFTRQRCTHHASSLFLNIRLCMEACVTDLYIRS